MVVHVEPASKTGFVVSFPRDTWVTIPGHGEDRLNAALELGGPSLLIQTITTNFNVPITHYLEVDIEGFQNIVNTIGGVKIYFPTPARDSFSGLNQPEAGCRELDGGQALTYVRARHYEWFDAAKKRWREDPRSDLSRIQRQQYFMRSLAQASLDRGASNPATAFALLNNISGSLQKDQNLQLSDIKGLINAFRDLDPQSIEMLTVPVVGRDEGRRAGRRAEAARRRSDPRPPPLVLEHRRGLPTPAAPGDVRVQVLNGSGVAGRGEEVLDGPRRPRVRVGRPGQGRRPRATTRSPRSAGRTAPRSRRVTAASVPRHRQRRRGPPGRGRQRGCHRDRRPRTGRVSSHRRSSRRTRPPSTSTTAPPRRRSPPRRPPRPRRRRTRPRRCRSIRPPVARSSDARDGCGRTSAGRVPIGSAAKGHVWVIHLIGAPSIRVREVPARYRGSLS